MPSYRQIRPIWSGGLELLALAQSQLHASAMTTPSSTLSAAVTPILPWFFNSPSSDNIITPQRQRPLTQKCHYCLHFATILATSLTTQKHEYWQFVHLGRPKSNKFSHRHPPQSCHNPRQYCRRDWALFRLIGESYLLRISSLSCQKIIILTYVTSVNVMIHI